MSGEVKNWLPGEPGKYVTILDLKERWMKKKHQEEPEEKKKQAEKEREEKKMVFVQLDDLKIGVGEEDQVETKRVRGRRLKSGKRGKCGMSSLKTVVVGDGYVKVREVHVGLNSQIDGRRHGVGNGDFLWVSKSEYKEVIDVKVYEDDLVGNDKSKLAASGSYRSGKRFSRCESSAKAMVSDVMENVDFDDEKSVGEKSQQTEEVDSIGDEKETRMSCPRHSRSVKQLGDGFWVCKYIEPVSGAEIGESVKGNNVMKGNVVEIRGKGNVGKRELRFVKNHKIARKVGEEMTAKQVKEDTMWVNGDSSRIIKRDALPRKTCQPRDKWEVFKEVKDKAFGKQMQKEEVLVGKDSQQMINRDGSCHKNNGKLQCQPVESLDEIEEHSKISAATEKERHHRRNFRSRGNPVGSRKINDTERFKAEKNSGSLTMDYVKKNAIHVNSNFVKVIDEVGAHRKNNDLTLTLENMESKVGPEKSEAAVGTEIVENSSDKFRGTRNETHGRKKFVNKRLPNGWTVSDERRANTIHFNGRMKEMKLEKGGLKWVKKEESSAGNAGMNN